MDTRAKLVDEVVKCAVRLQEWHAAKNDHTSVCEIVDPLYASVLSLRAHDAAKVEPLPFGCVARQKPDGNWQVENSEGTHWWSNTPSEGWLSENIDIATNRTCESALTNFRATNKGVPPPDWVEPTLNTSDGSAAPIEQDAGKMCNAASEYRTVTDPATIRAVLDMLPVGAKVRIDADFPGEPFRNQEASVYQSAGGDRYAEWRHGALYQASIALTSLTYRLADDPQATPAGDTATLDEIAHVNKSIPLEQRVNELDAWASRMAETVAAVKLRAAQHEMWVGDQIKTHEDQIEDLASRVAEVERRLNHETSARSVFEVRHDRIAGNITVDIAALRRDVDGLMATLETTSAEAIRANVRITRLNIEQRLGDDKPTPTPPTVASKPARYEVKPAFSGFVIRDHSTNTYYDVRDGEWWKSTGTIVIFAIERDALAVAAELEKMP